MSERRLQVLAWGVLFGALVAFLLLATGLPVALARYVNSATVPAFATVQRRAGSVTVENDGVSVLLAPSDREEVSAGEGTVVTTHGDGAAYVRLFDDATVQVEPNTRLTLVGMRRPRFSRGTARASVELAVEDLGETAGRVTAASTWAEHDIVLNTRDGSVLLTPESRARVTVTGDATTVYAMAGAVEASASGASLQLGPDKVTDLRAGRPPTRPRPALDEVLANGSFDRPPATGWKVRADGVSPGPEGPEVRVRNDFADGRWSLLMDRQRSEGRPGDIVLEQDLKSRTTADATFLGLTTTFRIDDQSLQAGGDRDQEYPLHFKLVLERADGSEEHAWEIGFYAVEPDDPEPPRPGDLGTFPALAVPRARWVTFATGNLLDPTAEATLDGVADSAWAEEARDDLALVERFDEPPMRLLRFEIIASGHDWTTHVDRVGLWAK